jgi:Fic family protein
MDIKASPTGKVIRTYTGYEAFIPNPLPPSIEWNLELINALSHADQIIGKLAGEGNKLPNPHLLLRPFIAREAVLSSRIEGTQATIGEVLADSVGVSVERSPDDLREVRNYVVALEYGLQRLSSLPLSLRLIKELHEKLMTGVRGDFATPGEFRKSQNWIGPPGCTLMNAKYVPVPPEQMMDSLGQFEEFLHNRTLPPLIHIALCHYQFEAIHPFLDGNGRVGRLLISLLLIERGILPSPLLYFSAFFEATRNEYYRQLFNVSATGSWNEWLIYCLNGMTMQASDVLSRAERINNLISQWLIEVSGTSSSLPAKMVDYLAGNPFVTANKAAEHFGVAFTTAQRSIQKLVELKILSQGIGYKHERVYCATKILEILEEPAKVYDNIIKI